MIPNRMANIDEARLEFGETVDRMAFWLTAPDALADEAIAATRGWSRRQLFQTLDECLMSGRVVPDELLPLVSHLKDVPAWLDRPAIARGGEFFMSTHAFGGFVLGARSLVLGFAAPAGNKPLMLSGRLEANMNRRLAETSQFVFDVCRSGGLAPEGPGIAAAAKVRLIHAYVRRMIQEHSEWNDDWGLPINQHDMMATVLLFSVVMLEGLSMLGLEPTEQESEDYIALWRYVGYLLGVADELLPTSLSNAKHLMAFVNMTQGAPDADAGRLTAAFLGASLELAKTPKAQKQARKQIQFAQTLTRHLLDDEVADGLGIPDHGPSSLLKILRVPLAAANTARRSQRGRTWAAAYGERYWEWVLKNTGESVEILMPERLLRRSVT
jgi:hypothetical protein